MHNWCAGVEREHCFYLFPWHGPLESWTEMHKLLKCLLLRSKTRGNSTPVYSELVFPFRITYTRKERKKALLRREYITVWEGLLNRSDTAMWITFMLTWLRSGCRDRLLTLSWLNWCIGYFMCHNLPFEWLHGLTLCYYFLFYFEMTFLAHLLLFTSCLCYFSRLCDGLPRPN